MKQLRVIILLLIIGSIQVFCTSITCSSSEALYSSKGLDLGTEGAPGNYTVDVGFDSNISFTPTELLFTYTSGNSCASDKVVYYTGSNATYQAVISNSDYASSYTTTTAGSSSGTSSELSWSFYGAIFITDDSFSVSYDESGTGDIFSASSNNIASAIDSKYELGSADSPCLFKYSLVSGISYEVTLTGANSGESCDVAITTSDSEAYTGEFTVEDESVTVNTSASTMSIVYGNLYNSSNEQVGYIGFDTQAFYFYDTDKVLLSGE